MAALLNKTLEIETSRRNLLKYGSLAGISSLAGINLLNTGALQNINILESSAALNNINSAVNNTYTGVPIDMYTIDIKDAYDLLGKVIGKTYDDDLLDELFSRFCLGK